MKDFSDYYRGFKKMEEFIFSDLKNATTKGHANFLVSMALFNYIEILGGFYISSTNSDKEAKRFNFVFTDLLPAEYKAVFEDIRNRIAKPYGLLRCGMTHGYLPVILVVDNQNIEISYTIFGANDESKYDQCIKEKKCGIVLCKNEKNKYSIEIYNPRLIHDFKIAFKTLKEKINNEDDYKTKFITRASELNLDCLT